MDLRLFGKKAIVFQTFRDDIIKKVTIRNTGSRIKFDVCSKFEISSLFLTIDPYNNDIDQITKRSFTHNVATNISLDHLGFDSTGTLINKGTTITFGINWKINTAECSTEESYDYYTDSDSESD